MFFVRKYLYSKNFKILFWILSFLLFISSQALFPITTFACSRAFQEVTPEQFKTRLSLIAPNKKDTIDNLDIDPSKPNSLSFLSKEGIQFQIKKDSSLTESEIELSTTSKVLKLPSYDGFKNSSSDSILKRWLIGHEVHPYTSPSKNILHTEAQNTALVAFKQALIEGAKSLLHISPTSSGKTLVMAKALKEKLQNHRKNKISFVTAHQIKLVDQLFEAIQQELRGMDVTVINWNNRLNKDFYVEIERSLGRTKPTVFVITTQSLKSQLSFLKNEKTQDYTRLVRNTDGIYIDEAHHLGAYHTKSTLLQLQERSEAFLYGTTATPIHHEVNLREFFEREHWSYLNTIEKNNLFASHPAEKVMEQLSIGIERGEITPFDTLYIIGESKRGKKGFNVTKENPLFIQPVNHLRVLNPYHYNTLAGVLHSIFQSNKKGFIVTATIAEAKRLTEFLNEAIEGITFEAYHSDMTKEQRQEVLQNSEKTPSHYIVAVKALDEGVNLPHLSAYIDLNVNVSVKQMVHRIGRVLRLHPGKTGADILFLADYRNEEMARDLLNLLNIVNISSFHKGIKYRDRSGDTSLREPEVMPLTREELQKLREELRESVRNFWDNKNKDKPTYEELIEILILKSIFSGTEWKTKRESDTDLQHIPKNLNSAYKEWAPNGGWEYVKKKAGRTKPTYEELIEILIQKNIFSHSEWEIQRENDPDLKHIPKKLFATYKEWSQKGEWEYVRRLAGKNKPSFEELIEILIQKNIFSHSEWEIQRNSDPDLQHIPKTLTSAYKEWVQNGGWKYVSKQAGREYKHSRGSKKPPYEKLIEILIQKNIFSQSEWKEQKESDPDLKHIPKKLSTAYKEWTPNGGWEYVRRQTGRTKPTYEELIEILIQKNIFSHPEWETQRESDPDLKHIPKILTSTYKEWKEKGGWEYVKKKAGREYNQTNREYRNKPTYEELIEILIQKNIFSQSEWKEQKESDPDLKHIPKKLSTAYKEWTPNGGWEYVRRQAGRTKPTYEELIEILIQKNIFSHSEWETQRESDPDLKHILKKLSTAYKEWAPNGGWEYVRKQAGKGKPTYEKLIEILIQKNIFSHPEWEIQRNSDPDLQYIPKMLSRGYKEWTQNGGWKYVREQANKEKGADKGNTEN